MPTSKSAEKRLRQNVTRRGRNRSVKGAIRTQLRKVHEAITAGDTGVVEEQFKKAIIGLDRAAAKNIIHPNAVARTKSRLNKKIKALKG